MSEAKKSSLVKKSTCYLLNIKTPDRTAKRLKMKFQSTAADLTLIKSGKVIGANLALTDISETGVGFFCEGLIPKGALAKFRIWEPTPIELIGVIRWSVPLGSGLIQKRYPFRSGMMFLISEEKQKIALVNYLKRIELETVVEVAQVENDDQKSAIMEYLTKIDNDAPLDLNIDMSALEAEYEAAAIAAASAHPAGYVPAPEDVINLTQGMEPSAIAATVDIAAIEPQAGSLPVDAAAIAAPSEPLAAEAPKVEEKNSVDNIIAAGDMEAALAAFSETPENNGNGQAA